jgi:apolipoprotein N-acyltransferase
VSRRRARDVLGTAVIAALLAFALRCTAGPIGWWWLLVPTLAAAIAFAADSEGISNAVAFRRGWLFGTFFVFGDLAWIIVPAASHLGPLLYLVATVISAFEALPIAIAAWLFARLEAGEAAAFCLGVPALYALLETARASGPLGLPLATLGATQTSGPFAVALAIGSVPFATFAALVPAATIVFLIRGVRGSHLTPRAVRIALLGCASGAMLLVAASLAWHGALAGRNHAALAHIAIVEAGPVGVGRPFAATAKDYATATQRLSKNVDFALWPEGVLYLIAPDAAMQGSIARAAARSFGGTILAGSTLRAGGLIHNDLVAIDPAGTFSSVYTKRRLVPFGEYQPFALGGSSRATYAAGADREPPVRIGGGTPFGALICYEVMFPDLTRDSANAGAGYLVAVLNDSWFGGTDGPGQLTQVLTAGAISSGIAIVRVDTVPPSGVIDADGAWVGSPLQSEGVAVVDVPPGIVTPFRRFGLLPALFVLAILAASALRPALRRRTVRRRSPLRSAQR